MRQTNILTMTLEGTQKYELHVSFNYNWLQIHYPGYFHIYQKFFNVISLTRFFYFQNTAQFNE